MPRRQPSRPVRSGIPPAEQKSVASPPPFNDPLYQEFLKAENEAYLAWLHYRPDGKHEDKQSLNALRSAYEERLRMRKAYQEKA